MKRVAWLTDLHLNFLTPERADAFLDTVAAREADAVLVSGDIAEAHDVLGHLARMADRLAAPIYFVLGNHDYYFGSIAGVRSQVAEFCRTRDDLRFLTVGDVFDLAPGTGLVGDDGWADGRLGDYERSLVSMYDYQLIEELAGQTKQSRLQILNALGDAAAAHIADVLPRALERKGHVVLLTHVPPLREACWHEGQISDDHWAPHFCCKAMGDAILEIMRGRPDRRLTVLCGHTHGSGETRPLENVLVLTGGARYGHPEVQRVFEWD